MSLKVIYVANVLVAGWIGITSLFAPKIAMSTIFSGAYQETELTKLVGALWLSIAILSVLGLWRPITFSPVLLLQLIYKGAWLLIVALPAIAKNNPYPKGMAIFFIIWVIVLPFVIPWKEWIN